MDSNEIVKALNNIAIKLDKPLIDANTLITVFAGFIGMFIGGIITYKLNIKQMKKSLVIDLQVKASQQLLQEINNFRTVISNIYHGLSSFTFNLNQYNRTLLDYIQEKGILFDQTIDSNGKIETSSFVTFYAGQLDENVQKDLNRWEEMDTAFTQYCSTYESNQVKLSEFKNIYDFLLNEIGIFREARGSIINDYQMIIKPIVSARKIINNDMLNKIESEWEVFTKVYFDLIGHFQDFIYELQNKYLSELFNNYKIPKRQPKDKNIKVLTIDKDI